MTRPRVGGVRDRVGFRKAIRLARWMLVTRYEHRDWNRMTAPKQIGIAVVEYGGRYLIGIRGAGVPLAGYAEFPGGKCLAGESATACAVRECLEESGLAVIADKLLQRTEFEYPHGRVDLHFILCHPAKSEDIRERHNQFGWVPAEKLKSLKFPEANASIVEELGP